MTKPPQRTSMGFTLIELMVVLVIIGIVSAVMIPEMTGTYQDALLRSSGRELIGAFNVASSKAVSIGRLHRFRLDASTGRFAIECQSGGNPSEGRFTPVQGSEGAIDRRISIQIHRSARENPADNETADSSDQEELPDPADIEDAVRFFPDGTADARTILLEDPAGFRLAFRINPVTSKVHVMEVERK